MIYLELFLTFFKIGLFTVGGGYAMLPLIEEEAVSNGWMTMEQLVNFIAVSESTPGPFAINIATYIGTQTGGFAGALCATLGVVLPSFIIILLVSGFYLKFRSSRTVGACMSGLRPAVIGLIGAAVVSIGSKVFFPSGIALSVFTDYSFITSAVIFIAMLILIFKKLNPIAVIGISALSGIAAGYVEKYLFA